MRFQTSLQGFILFLFFLILTVSCVNKATAVNPLENTSWRIAKIEREKENDPVKDSVFSSYDKELETMVYAFKDSTCTVIFRGHEETADYKVNGSNLVFTYGPRTDTSRIVSQTSDSLILQLSPKLRARMVKVK